MTIETVTKFRTDDGQEFDSEADAIKHEKWLELYEGISTRPKPSLSGDPELFWKVVIDDNRDAILEYLTGEDLPQPHPAPTFGYRDGDSIEPVHPILFRGEVIRQPEDAWNACRRYALELVSKELNYPGLGSQSPEYKIVLKVRDTLRSKLTLDEELKNAETPPKSGEPS